MSAADGAESSGSGTLTYFYAQFLRRPLFKIGGRARLTQVNVHLHSGRTQLS